MGTRGGVGLTQLVFACLSLFVDADTLLAWLGLGGFEGLVGFGFGPGWVWVGRPEVLVRNTLYTLT
jgi:hypothetical protein